VINLKKAFNKQMISALRALNCVLPDLLVSI